MDLVATARPSAPGRAATAWRRPARRRRRRGRDCAPGLDEPLGRRVDEPSFLVSARWAARWRGLRPRARRSSSEPRARPPALHGQAGAHRRPPRRRLRTRLPTRRRPTTIAAVTSARGVLRAAAGAGSSIRRPASRANCAAAGAWAALDAQALGVEGAMTGAQRDGGWSESGFARAARCIVLRGGAAHRAGRRVVAMVNGSSRATLEGSRGSAPRAQSASMRAACSKRSRRAQRRAGSSTTAHPMLNALRPGLRWIGCTKDLHREAARSVTPVPVAELVLRFYGSSPAGSGPSMLSLIKRLRQSHPAFEEWAGGGSGLREWLAVPRFVTFSRDLRRGRGWRRRSCADFASPPRRLPQAVVASRRWRTRFAQVIDKSSGAGFPGSSRQGGHRDAAQSQAGALDRAGGAPLAKRQVLDCGCGAGST